MARMSLNNKLMVNQKGITMKRNDLLLLLDELFEEEQGTLQGPELLSQLDGWDSLTSLGFIALIDEHFNLVVPPNKLSECKTVNDLLMLVDGHLSV